MKIGFLVATDLKSISFGVCACLRFLELPKDLLNWSLLDIFFLWLLGSYRSSLCTFFSCMLLLDYRVGELGWKGHVRTLKLRTFLPVLLSNVFFLSSDSEITRWEWTHIDYTSQRILLGRAFSHLVLNTCFSCSTNSDFASAIFLLALKMTVKRKILVYLKWNKKFLSTRSFMVHNSPGQLPALHNLLNPSNCTWVSFGYLRVGFSQLYSM